LFKRFNFLKEEDGIAVVWFSIVFIVIVFIAGMAIDGGRLYEAKSELRKAADAAVLSGAQELVISNSSVSNIVDKILIAHNEQDSLKNIKINNEKSVTAALEKQVPLYFMKIFNFSTAPVSVQSTAAIYPVKETTGTVPFGIHKDVQLEYMKEYELKVDSGDSIIGNFGILALAGVGGKLYEDALKYGYDSDIVEDQIIDTQTGNIEQKTVHGVNYRIDASPYETGDITHRDDPRIITVLVYEPYKITARQVKSVKICGFATFYLEQPMSPNDSTVKGYFIKKVSIGKGDETALDRGTYAIKLVE